MPSDVITRPIDAGAMRAMIAPGSWNPEQRTVDVVWTTGAPVTRFDWWTNTRFTEILDVTEGAVDLGRLNAGAPVLDTHSSYSLESQIGVVLDGSATIRNGQGRATIKFSDREDIAGLVRDIGNGIIRNVSVGYRVEKWEIQEATATAGEIRTAKRWTPYELSFVPIPADAGAQTRAAPEPSPTTPPAARAASQEPNMTTQAQPATTTAAPDEAAIRAEAVATERTRVAELGVIARQAGLPADLVAQMVKDGTTVDQARAQALAAVEARATPRVPAEAAGGRQDAGETDARLLQNALEVRARVPGVALEDGARQYRGFRLIDFARHSIEMAGGKHRGMTAHETFREALRMGQMARMMGTRAGAHTTGDFPDLLANTASKMLRASYTAAPRTFLPWTSQVNLPDFKTFKTVALSGMSSLAPIEEDGEVTYGTIDDTAESWALLRYGKAIAITYVAMINDDMSGFTRVPQMMAAAAARKESDVVYAILTANAAMGDGTTLFHATHGNTSTGALSVDATGVANLGAMEAKLAVQTAPNGEILNLSGRFLVLPAALKIKALQLFSDRIVPATAGAANPLPYEIIAEGRLDATSTAAHYLIADPSTIDTIQWGHLDGADGPEISSDVDFDTDGMKTKVMHNFGAKAIDWRGMVYTTGA